MINGRKFALQGNLAVLDSAQMYVVRETHVEAFGRSARAALRKVTEALRRPIGELNIYLVDQIDWLL